MSDPEKKTYDVTLNEIVARTYRVQAESPEAAIEVAKDSPDTRIDQDWVDYWGDPNPETDVEEVITG